MQFQVPQSDVVGLQGLQVVGVDLVRHAGLVLGFDVVAVGEDDAPERALLVVGPGRRVLDGVEVVVVGVGLAPDLDPDLVQADQLTLFAADDVGVGGNVVGVLHVERVGLDQRDQRCGIGVRRVHLQVLRLGDGNQVRPVMHQLGSVSTHSGATRQQHGHVSSDGGG